MSDHLGKLKLSKTGFDLMFLKSIASETDFQNRKILESVSQIGKNGGVTKFAGA